MNDLEIFDDVYKEWEQGLKTEGLNCLALTFHKDFIKDWFVDNAVYFYDDYDVDRQAVTELLRLTRDYITDSDTKNNAAVFNDLMDMKKEGNEYKKTDKDRRAEVIKRNQNRFKKIIEDLSYGVTTPQQKKFFEALESYGNNLEDYLPKKLERAANTDPLKEFLETRIRDDKGRIRIAIREYLEWFMHRREFMNIVWKAKDLEDCISQTKSLAQKLKMKEIDKVVEKVVNNFKLRIQL